jgi:hypothetical protein
VGGLGGGRWAGSNGAIRVEDCLVLDLGGLVRAGAIALNSIGTFHWRQAGRSVASVGFSVESAQEGSMVLRLAYHRNGEKVSQAVPLESTGPRFGVRWWGRCPGPVAGVGCGIRVAKLYLPPGERFFACRRCHALTYASVQEAHRIDGVQNAIAADLGCTVAELRRTIRQLVRQRKG